MNKVAIITGASGGIGKDLAIAFGRVGYKLALCYNKNRGGAEKLKDLLALNDIEAEIFGCDLSKFAEAKKLGEIVKEKFGRIDVLINNAGTEHYALFTDTEEEDYRRVFDVNIGSAIAVSSGVVPFMLSRGGSIINISSVWGVCGGAGEVLYSASKASLIGFTKALAKETAKSSVRVNCIAPGAIDTPMLDRFSDEEKQEIIKETPLGRLGKGQDIASLALFLSSPDAEFITGQVIESNGGFHI